MSDSFLTQCYFECYFKHHFKVCQQTRDEVEAISLHAVVANIAAWEGFLASLLLLGTSALAIRCTDCKVIFDADIVLKLFNNVELW